VNANCPGLETVANHENRHQEFEKERENSDGSTVKEIPGPRTQPQELILLLSLRLRAIDTQAKRPTLRLWTTAKRRSAHVPFILGSRAPSSAVQAGGLSVDVTEGVLVWCRTMGRW